MYVNLFIKLQTNIFFDLIRLIIFSFLTRFK